MQNFLSYVNSGEYNNTLFYRADSGFVIQTGADYPVDPNGNNFSSTTPGDTVVGNIDTLSNSPTVQNEYSDTRPQHRGRSRWPNSAAIRIAPARSGLSIWVIIRKIWIIRTADSRCSGQVIGNGMSVAQTIGNLPTLSDYGGSGSYAELPLINLQSENIEADNLVLVPSVSVVPAISYSVSSTNTGVVSPSLNGANLSLAYGVGGNAQVTITATDVLGDTKSETFNVTVQPGATPTISVSQNNQPITSGQSTAVSLGSVTQGTTSPSLAFTIANTGNAALNFSSISLSGGFTLLSPPASQSIAAGGSETFVVALPTTSGTFTGNIAFTTNDPSNANFSVPISGVVKSANVALAITSAAGATFTAGSAGSFTISTTGLPVAALSESGSLPNGVTFIDNGDGSATLSGTPAAGSAGVYDLIIDAGNGVSPDATQDFVLTVNASSTPPFTDVTTHLVFTPMPANTTSPFWRYCHIGRCERKCGKQ